MRSWVGTDRPSRRLALRENRGMTDLTTQPGAAQPEVLGFQIVADCREPHRLAEWWALTLGWEVEAQDEAFIRSMLERGLASEVDTTTYRDRLVWRDGAAVNPPAGAPGVRLLFVRVPEGKTVKNRMHLDLRGASDTEALRASLLARGAVRIGEGQQGPHSWVVMADPEDNEFCV